MPSLDAAHNLARWLTRNDHDAEDLVQEAVLRAFRYFDSFRGERGRQWLLKIVRSTFYTQREKDHGNGLHEPMSEATTAIATHEAGPEEVAQRHETALALRNAIEGLPLEFREVLVLREFEGCSYREIADTVNIPIGTVMSRLARAREHLRRRLTGAETGAHL
jgi:RNA polymerase sigma-70 factor (ECF subfamily)